MNKSYLVQAIAHVSADLAQSAAKLVKAKRKVSSLKVKVRDLKMDVECAQADVDILTDVKKALSSERDFLLAERQNQYDVLAEVRKIFGVSEQLSERDAMLTISNMVGAMRADLDSYKTGYYKTIEQRDDAIKAREEDNEFMRGINRTNAKLEQEQKALNNKVEFYEKLLTDICTELGYGTHFANHPMLPGMVKESVRTFQSDIDMWRKHRDNNQAIIQDIRAAAKIEPTVGDGLVATCIRDQLGTVESLNAALHHAQAHMTKVWAHKEKGGRYRNLGQVIQAGVFADRDDQDYVAYQCLESGNTYVRLGTDFDDKMHIIEDLSNA